jgi:hypothetical protein
MIPHFGACSEPVKPNETVVCAFAFGPYVNEETTRWPNLTIVITRMNPDLAVDTAD